MLSLKSGMARCCLVFWLLVLAAAAVPQGRKPVQAAPSNDAKPAEQVYKNIRVLKGIPANEIIPGMQFVTASLGVECGFCHVENHFEQDNKKPKQIARTMMQMEMAINGNSFEHQLKVTCNSCHRGSRTPVATPAISDSPSLPPPEPE